MCLGAIYWARPDRVYFAASQQDATNAGFDDTFIYEQIARPPVDRSIPMIHIPAKEAREVFELWLGNPGRVPY